MNELTKRLKGALEAPSFVSTGRRAFFYPSSVSVEIPSPLGKKVIGSCLRQQYYDFVDELPSNTGETDYRISADLGDKVSELILQYIDTHGYKLGLQRLAVEHRFFDPRINVSGRVDLILWDHINNECIGVEVKSVGEYKAGKAMEQPAAEHMMQAILYLDYFQKNMPAGQAVPKKWYIWYCSRTENYTIKAKKHGSPLTMLWDYYVTLDENGIPTIHGHHKVKTLPDFSVSNIHKRFSALANYINNKELPPRDYELAYSPEKITSLYKLDMLTRKADKEAVEKWLGKGAPEGKLKVQMGDFECNLCAWKDKCWGLSNNTIPKIVSNLPAQEVESEQKKPELPLW